MKKTNLDYWEEYGDYLIPVMPFMDSVIAKSEGSYLIDVEGNRILDLAAGQFCSILGHNHPLFVKKVKEELAKNLHTGAQYVTEKVLEAAKRLAEITPPGLDRVIFLSTGTEANEFAMRVAKLSTGRNGILGYDRGYYGISLATRSLSTISAGPGHVDYTPKSPETYHVIAPACSRCPLRLTYPDCRLACLEVSKSLLDSYVENIAAIFVETVISAGGMIYPSREYMQALRDYASEIGALLVVDESQTGFGRCGRWFDCENLDVQPDILVFSKTSGNGYPTAGVVVSEEITTKLLDRGFYHLSSHQNDPVAAVSVMAVIEIIEREGYLERCRERGGYFLERLKELETRQGHIANVRGRGLMIAFELVTDKEDKTPYREIITPFTLACKAHGVHLTYTYHEGVIRLLPSLDISEADIDKAIEVFERVLTDLRNDNVDMGKIQQKNKVTTRITRRSKIRQKFGRLWETSPEYWVQKIKGR